jgi:hypothetical protein
VFENWRCTCRIQQCRLHCHYHHHCILVVVWGRTSVLRQTRSRSRLVVAIIIIIIIIIFILHIDLCHCRQTSESVPKKRKPISCHWQKEHRGIHFLHLFGALVKTDPSSVFYQYQLSPCTQDSDTHSQPQTNNNNQATFTTRISLISSKKHRQPKVCTTLILV